MGKSVWRRKGILDAEEEIEDACGKVSIGTEQHEQDGGTPVIAKGGGACEGVDGRELYHDEAHSEKEIEYTSHEGEDRRMLTQSTVA